MMKPQGDGDPAKEVLAQTGCGGDVSQEARSMMARQKECVAETVGGVALALKETANQLSQGGANPSLAHYAGYAARKLETAAVALKERDLGQLARDAEDFARARPLLVAGGALAAGFILARMMAGGISSPGDGGSRPEEGGR